MVGQALDFAGIQSGRRVYHPRPVEVGEIVDGALQDCRWLLQEKQIRVEREVEPGLPAVLVDAAALRRAIANLSRTPSSTAAGRPGSASGCGARLRRAGGDHRRRPRPGHPPRGPAAPFRALFPRPRRAPAAASPAAAWASAWCATSPRPTAAGYRDDGSGGGRPPSPCNCPPPAPPKPCRAWRRRRDADAPRRRPRRRAASCWWRTSRASSSPSPTA